MKAQHCIYFYPTPIPVVFFFFPHVTHKIPHVMTFLSVNGETNKKFIHELRLRINTRTRPLRPTAKAEVPRNLLHPREPQ